MSNTAIQLKKSGISGNTPIDLQHGEVAINYADGKLYYKNSVDAVVSIQNQESFSTISANGRLVLATSGTDILTLTPNSGVSIIANTQTKALTIGLREDQITSFVKKSGDTMTGNLGVTGNVAADYIIVNETLYSGLATRDATPLPNLIAQFTGNSTTYIQVNAQNIDEHGSADYVVTADVGDDTTFYIDMGIQGSQLNQGAVHALDGYLLVQGNTGQVGGNLVIGTISGTPGQEIRFVNGGYEDDNVIVIMESSNTTIKTDLTVDGIIYNTGFQQQGIRANAAFSRANDAYILATAAYAQANTGGGGGGGTGTIDSFQLYHFPTGDYGSVSDSLYGGLGMEAVGPMYDMRVDPLVAGLISLDLGSL